jgi:CelD/BcsL family acetyltransferase involved in cellulose biosynthesis
VSGPRLIHLDGAAALRTAASSWDDLWLRSEVALPTVRAEMITQWCEQFSRPGDFHALVVEDEGRWVAALPLVRRADSRLLRAGRMTANEWSTNGDLLLYPDARAEPVLDVLTAGIGETPWQVLWLNDVPIEAARWKAFQRALDRGGTASDYRGQIQVGMIQVGDDWQAYRRSLSKKHRAKMARCNRRLAERGEVRLELISQPQPDELDTCLRTAFQIEDRSWKGDVGTSVLRSPGMFEFFVRQARQLAAWGQLELALLYCGDEPIAFSYGYAAKGVSHWHKIGYDPEYASCTPGQLLQCHLLERFSAQGDRRAVDTMGPLTGALAQWNAVPYQLGRLMIVPRGLMARPLLHACKCGASCLRRLRGVQRGGSPNGKGKREKSDSVRSRMIATKQTKRSSKIRRGQIVEVRRPSEIFATLDSEGRLEGLPFQPEMLAHCGRSFRVCRRAETVFLDHHYYVAKLDHTVLLENVRCDGRAHHGCQMGCMLFWKEAWLKPLDDPSPTDPSGDGQSPSSAQPRLPVLQGDRFCCQATELVRATRRLPWWDVRQDVDDLTSGEWTFREKAFMGGVLVYNRIRRICGLPPCGQVCGSQQQTPRQSLNLQPGTLVEVKSREEIEATLDAHGKNRGLGFGGSMLDFCGRRYRVASRVDRLILEWSGRMRKLADTVVLENVLCDGLDKRGCPRGCYHLWREIWLKRLPEPACPTAAPAPEIAAKTPGVLSCLTGQEQAALAPQVDEAS